MRIEKRRKDLKFPVCLKTKKPIDLHTERACSVMRYSISPLMFRLCFVRNKASNLLCHTSPFMMRFSLSVSPYFIFVCLILEEKGDGWDQES